MRLAFLVSAVLHGFVGLLLVAAPLLWSSGKFAGLPVLAEVELVEQPTSAVGPFVAPSATSPPAKATIAIPPILKPAPGARRSELSSAGRPLPSPARLNLSAPGTGLVSGTQVIPASLDQKARNPPPIYPREAVQRAEQGTVVLNVHITADGGASAVDVIQSSGYLLLDQTARQAVAAWHFIAARRQGTAVSSAMLVRIRFALDDPVNRQ